MAVAKDAVSNVTLTTGQASGLNIGLTVGASATFLVIGIEQDAATPGAPNWDSAGTNQLMTSLGTAITNGTSSPTMTLALYGLVNPTPGAKLVKLNGSSNGSAYVSGMSFTGSETSSVAAAIEGYATNQGSATNATVSSGVAIPTGDMAVTFYNNIPGFTNAFTPGSNPGDGGTAIAKNEGGTTNMAAEYYSGAGSTISSSAANASSAGFVAAIVGIKAPASAAAAPIVGGSAPLFAPALGPGFNEAFKPALAFPPAAPVDTTRAGQYAPQIGPLKQFKPSLAFPPAAPLDTTRAGQPAQLFAPLLGPQRFKPSLAYPAFPNNYVMPVTTGAYVIGGNTVNLLSGRVVSITTGTYTINGNAVSLPVYNLPVASGAPRLFAPGLGPLTRFRPALAYPSSGPALNNYTLPVTTGSYVIGANAVSLLKGSLLPVTTGTYAISGNAVGLLKGSLLSVTTGSYSISGNTVGLFKGYQLSVNVAAYVINGIAVSLRNFKLIPDTGLYSITGYPVALLASGAPDIIADTHDGGSSKYHKYWTGLKKKEDDKRREREAREREAAQPKTVTPDPAPAALASMPIIDTAPVTARIAELEQQARAAEEAATLDRLREEDEILFLIEQEEKQLLQTFMALAKAIEDET